MQFELIDHNGGNPVIYDSLLLPPDKMGIFSSELSLKIIQELVKEPACAMDLARRMNQHEQKIYYHLRRLEGAGVVKHIRSEKRYSMTAKIYGVVSPVVSAKLFEKGRKVIKKTNGLSREMDEFFQPFVEEGKLNATIVIGDPYPHGKYDKPDKSAAHAFDFMMMLGNIVNELNFPHYKLDIDIREKDLKDNLILIGNPKTNTIMSRLDGNMPVFFDPKSGWAVVSKKTSKKYDEPRVGVIMKMDSPFQAGKKILVVAGIRTRGMQAATIALTRYFKKTIKKSDEQGNLFRIVEGVDQTGDHIIDNVKFLE